MTDDSSRAAPFWVRFDPTNQTQSGALAVLRQGFDREPGDVPGMWPYYVHLTQEGRLTRKLTAEHLALSMFGLHQQGIRTKVHRGGAFGQPSFAAALHRLRASGRFSEAALDARVAQAATAPDVRALAYHLRGLITMLKAIPDSAFNYDGLLQDLQDWQDPARAGRVRLNWGIAYQQNPASQNTTAQNSTKEKK